jgi:hypothetical protein
MNAKLVSAICFKLLAIYAIISIIIALPAVWALYFGLPNMRQGLSPSIIVPILSSISSLILGAALLLTLWKISDSILNNLNDAEGSYALSLKSGYMLLGAYFLISGLSSTPNAIINMWRASFIEDTDLLTHIQILSNPAVLIIAGTVLLIKKGDAKNLYKKLKYAGV